MDAHTADEVATSSGRLGWQFELVDLSRPLTKDTVVALFGDLVEVEPYFSNISQETAMDFSTGNSHASFVTIPDHVSTHIDAPLHMVEGGAGLEGMDITKLIGEAAVVDLYRGDVDYGYTAGGPPRCCAGDRGG